MVCLKVWSGDRSVKKAVAIANDSELTVNNVIISACGKLKIPFVDGLKLVLDEDGTEVDDDNVLKEYSACVMRLLKPNEEWRADGVTILVNENDDDGKRSSVRVGNASNRTFDEDQKPDIASLPRPSHQETPLRNAVATRKGGQLSQPMANAGPETATTSDDAASFSNDCAAGVSACAAPAAASGEIDATSQSIRELVDKFNATKTGIQQTIDLTMPGLQKTTVSTRSTTQPTTSSVNQKDNQIPAEIQSIESGHEKSTQKNGASETTTTTKRRSQAQETFIAPTGRGRKLARLSPCLQSPAARGADTTRSSTRMTRTRQERSDNSEQNSRPSSASPEGHVRQHDDIHVSSFTVVKHEILTGKPTNAEEPPELVDSLSGVAHISGKLYFVNRRRNLINICDISPPYKCHPPIKVTGLGDPHDIVAACEPTYDCLYVLDAKPTRIFKIVIGSRRRQNPPVLINLPSSESGTLSVSPTGEIFYSSFLRNCIDIYRADGQPAAPSVTLPTRIFEGLLHTVSLKDQDGNPRLLIAHGLTTAAQSIRLTSRNGKDLFGSFGERAGSSDNQLNNPSYLAIRYTESETNGIRKCKEIFVADEENDRILVLNSKLKLKRVIDDVERPHRLCYVESEDVLIVASKNVVKLYCCRDFRSN